MVKVLICGGRDFSDDSKVLRVLKRVKPSLVITGGCRGADRLADRIAERLGIPRAVYPANWNGEGKKAGILRNQRMLDEAWPDLVIAFPGGRGTEDMVTRAEQAGFRVERID